MRNLIRVSLYHILKTPIFLTEVCIAVFLPVFILGCSYFELNLTNAYVYKVVAQFFGHVPIVGVMTVVLSVKICGQDYESGTLRNKIICGHKRQVVYLSQLITSSIAACILTLVWLTVNICIGIPMLGIPGNKTVEELILYILADLLSAIAFSALFTFLSHIFDTESKSLLLCLISIVGFIILGLILCKRFTMPQYKGWVEYGGISIPAENGLYVGGIARIILEFIICFLPGTQSVLLLNMDVEHMLFPLLGSILSGAIFTLIGLFHFQTKDIR